MNKKYRIAEIHNFDEKTFVPQVETEAGVWENVQIIEFCPCTLQGARAILDRITYVQKPTIYHPYP